MGSGGVMEPWHVNVHDSDTVDPVFKDSSTRWLGGGGEVDLPWGAVK